jgi:hypothetical protein
MGLRRLAITLLTGLSTAVSYSSSTSAAAPPCSDLRGDPVVAQDRLAALFYDGGGELWSCSKTTGIERELVLGNEGEHYFGGPAVDLSGAVAAYPVVGGDTAGPGTKIYTTVVNRANGAPLTRRDKTLTPPGQRGGGWVRIGSLRVTGRAAVAWIQCPQRNENDFYYSQRPNCTKPGLSVNSIYKVGSNSFKPVLLDRGRGVDPASLMRVGSRIYWRHSGKRRSSSIS